MGTGCSCSADHCLRHFEVASSQEPGYLAIESCQSSSAQSPWVPPVASLRGGISRHQTTKRLLPFLSLMHPTRCCRAGSQSAVAECCGEAPRDRPSHSERRQLWSLPSCVEIASLQSYLVTAKDWTDLLLVSMSIPFRAEVKSPAQRSSRDLVPQPRMIWPPRSQRKCGTTQTCRCTRFSIFSTMILASIHIWMSSVAQTVQTLIGTRS